MTITDDDTNQITQVFSSEVRFRCPSCQSAAETRVSVPEPSWDVESLSDLYSEGTSYVVCPSCDNEFQVYVFFTHSEITVTFNEHPDVQVDADSPSHWPPENEWTDTGPTSDPHEVYSNSYQALNELLDARGAQGGHDLINRMVFSQHITAMEAYLADTLINVVRGDDAALKRLVSEENELRKMKFSLAEIDGEEGIVKKKVSEYLKSLLYHNLQKVDWLYKCVLDIRILDNPEKNGLLLQAIKYRHDCVHRNGSDVEGNPPSVYTLEYVKSTADLVKALVDRIEEHRMPAF